MPRSHRGQQQSFPSQPKMMQMFESANAFNQPLAWDTSKVTNAGLYSAFYKATAFNSELAWDTSRAMMEGTFAYANAFTQPLAWDATSVTAWSGFGQ